MSDHDYCLIYSTHPSPEQARTTATALVNEKLAACCNLIPGMESLYLWEGKLTNVAEVVLISKTAAGKATAAMGRIRALHPYDTPAIVALPLAGGDPRFLAWIDEQCG